MSKRVLFTHNDMDGYGCKLIFELWCNYHHITNYEVFVCSNSDLDKTVIEYWNDLLFIHSNESHVYMGTEIYFGDIAPNKETLRTLLYHLKTTGAIGKLTICDHHATNLYIKDLCMDTLADVDISVANDMGVAECGTSILYRKLFADINPSYDNRLLADLVDHIRSYDTYEWKTTKNMMAKKLNVLFTMIGGDNFCKKYFKRITEKNTPDTSPDLISKNDLEFVDCKCDLEQKTIDNMTLNDIVDVNIRGYRVALMTKSVPANISEVAYQFLEKYQEFDAFISFSLFDDGKIQIRTRRDDLDVSITFAKPIGGGGHPKASGAPLPEYIQASLKDILTKWLNGNEPSITVTSSIVYEDNRRIGTNE